MTDTSKITRVELIDYYTGNGRIYAMKPREDMTVEVSVQDDGRTLKVFMDKRPKTLAKGT